MSPFWADNTQIEISNRESSCGTIYGIIYMYCQLIKNPFKSVTMSPRGGAGGGVGLPHVNPDGEWQDARDRVQCSCQVCRVVLWKSVCP